MSKNIVMVLAVVVALLAGWLALELASRTTPSSQTEPVSTYSLPEDPGPKTVETSVEVSGAVAKTSVEVE